MNIATFHLARRAAAVAGFSLVVIPLTMAQSGYAVGDSSNPGPVRMARISFTASTVEYRPTSSVGWSNAVMNTPIRQGAEVWAKPGGKSEMQFDDGSVLRLGSGGIATLATMYSDSNGEFTELKITNGLATVHIKSKLSQFQVDTPSCSVKASGPATIRVGINGNVCEIADQAGQAQVQGPSGTRTLNSGQLIDYRGPAPGGTAVAAESVRNVPAADDWDKWSSERDTEVYHQNQYLPPDENLVAGNLDEYGTWHNDPKYGHIWAPREASADWRPYRDGSWTWVSPFGWTWTGREDWGWAPYHYGTWYHASYGWGWAPGPESQYWSPAVVDFSDDGANVAWAPLAPWEVQYPAALSIGFSGGDWGLSFSIGQAGCYYPGDGDFCVGRPWANSFANAGYGYYDPGYMNNYYAQISLGSGGFYGQSRFRPYNAYHSNGAVMASYSSFGHGGSYRGLAANQASNVFSRGRSYTGSPRGSQISGPIGVRPNTASYTPSHSFTRGNPPANIAGRSVYRAPVRGNIARQSGNPGRVLNPSTRVAGGARTAPNATRPNGAAMNSSRTATRNGMAVAHNENTAATRNGKNAMAAAHQGVGASAQNRNAVAAAAHNRNAAGIRGRTNAHGGNTVAAAAHNRNAAAAQNRVAATRRVSTPVRSAPRRLASTRRANTRTSVANNMHRSTTRSTSALRRAPRAMSSAPRSAPRSSFSRPSARPAPRSFGGGGSRPAPRQSAPRQSAPRGGGSGGKRHP